MYKCFRVCATLALWLGAAVAGAQEPAAAVPSPATAPAQSGATVRIRPPVKRDAIMDLSMVGRSRESKPLNQVTSKRPDLLNRWFSGLLVFWLAG